MYGKFHLVIRWESEKSLRSMVAAPPPRGVSSHLPPPGDEKGLPHMLISFDLFIRALGIKDWFQSFLHNENYFMTLIYY